MARRHVTEIREGDDPYRILKNAYEYKRTFPDGKNPHGYRQPERAPHRLSPAPDWNDYRAGFHEVKNTSVSKPLDESGPQFRDSKAAHLNDCANTWVRGYIQRPAFDNHDGVVSGNRYDSKIRK
jgi:hypothetical protein